MGNLTWKGNLAYTYIVCIPLGELRRELCVSCHLIQPHSCIQMKNTMPSLYGIPQESTTSISVVKGLWSLTLIVWSGFRKITIVQLKSGSIFVQKKRKRTVSVKNFFCKPLSKDNTVTVQLLYYLCPCLNGTFPSRIYSVRK